jgi:hypothetical protein
MTADEDLRAAQSAQKEAAVCAAGTVAPALGAAVTPLTRSASNAAMPCNRAPAWGAAGRGAALNCQVRSAPRPIQRSIRRCSGERARLPAPHDRPPHAPTRELTR